MSEIDKAAPAVSTTVVRVSIGPESRDIITAVAKRCQKEPMEVLSGQLRSLGPDIEIEKVGGPDLA